MNTRLLLPLIIATCTLTACSTAKVDPYQGDQPQYIFAVGHTDLQKGDYDKAIAAFQSLNSQYPFDDYSKQGDLDLIYAQYADHNSALALAAANRFLKLYPNDPGVAYAYYMRGVINFDNGRSFLQRYFPYDMADHDPVEYRNAFQDFNVVVTNYPNSPYAPDARRRMIYLNNVMGQYQLNVAEYYYKMHAYVAAITRAKVVLLHYSTTPAVQGALVTMVESYQALNLPNLEQSARLLLKANFPDNALVKDMPMPEPKALAEATSAMQAPETPTAAAHTAIAPTPKPFITVKTPHPLKIPSTAPDRPNHPSPLAGS